MLRFSHYITALVISIPAVLAAQSSSVIPSTPEELATLRSASSRPAIQGAGIGGPFSRAALGVGVSPLGITLTAATNLNCYMNLRGTGNIFNYTAGSFSTNGFNVTPKLTMDSAGASLDYYPFPRHGFRLSPGVLFYNKNNATAAFNVQGGTSFTLNNYTYYASSSNPVLGSGSLGLHSNNPAFMATTGWGNVIPRSGKHWSFPFEIGAAFIGAPTVNIALTSGQVCDASGLNCVNVATDLDVQANLQAQIAKYKSDLDPLKTYPIVSFGVAYSFSTRRY